MNTLRRIEWKWVVAAGAIALMANREASAGFKAYTSSAAFQSALTYSTVENYSSGFQAGQKISNGTTLDGLTYNFATNSSLQGGIITSTYNSFTGLSLGGNQAGGAQFFFDGDQFTVTFAKPVDAIGLFFNVNLNSGTFGLTTSAGSASTGSAAYDTSTFVFAGLISTTAFTSATFSSTSSGAGTASYNVPEFIYQTVPEPSSVCLIGIGLATLGLGHHARNRRRA